MTAVHMDDRRRWWFVRRFWAFIKAALPTVLVFVIAGPLIGYFAIILPIALTAIDGPSGAIQGVAGAIALLPFGALFAYATGYLPALLTGLFVAVSDCFADMRDYRTAAASAAGSGITVLLLFTVIGTDSLPELGASGFGAIAASVGAIAGGVCAMIAPRRVPLLPSA